MMTIFTIIVMIIIGGRIRTAITGVGITGITGADIIMGIVDTMGVTTDITD